MLALKRIITNDFLRNNHIFGKFLSSFPNEQNDPSFESLTPNKIFIDQLDDEKKRALERTLKEFEIFCYMGKFIPQRMNEYDWKKILEMQRLEDKVGYWEHLGMKHIRETTKKKSKVTKMEEVTKHFEEQRSIFEAGGMGYGPEMYQMLQNPMRNKKKLNQIGGYKIYQSMVTEMPKIALDVQYVPTTNHRHKAELGNQMQYTISENFAAKRPFPLTFVNVPNGDFVEDWMKKSVGYYGGAYTTQTLLPDFTTKGIKEEFNLNSKNKISSRSDKPKAVYISRFARDVIDGPLDSDIIGLCVTMDLKRESLAAARRAGIRPVRLPIHRYVQWKSGPQVLPFPNILNILREVYENGGDWSTALHNNISRRHLVDMSESERLMKQSLIRKSKMSERLELIQAIRMATA